jgi:hypothetical protein
MSLETLRANRRHYIAQVQDKGVPNYARIIKSGQSGWRARCYTGRRLVWSLFFTYRHDAQLFASAWRRGQAQPSMEQAAR